MKRLLALIFAALACTLCLCACKTENDNNSETPPQVQDETEDGGVPAENLSAGGYVKDKIPDFSQYENTSFYRKVTTAEEFISAIYDAKAHYVSEWDGQSVQQSPAAGYNEETAGGSVRVIEVANDLELGYKTLSASAMRGIVDNYASKQESLRPYLYMSEMLDEYGVSQIKAEGISNLLVYSKTGAKLSHCGFKLTSDDRVVFRNLSFDGLWQWEDAPVKESNAIGDYDAFGWAYFKIAFCGYIWIDHCTFGKSYDGQIDVSNPFYSNESTAFRAPYGADGASGVHISFCRFGAGSADEDGYLYKMMKSIEDGYLSGSGECLYYNALRDGGITFEQILYGLAIPQKKGFLCGDSAKYTEPDYEYNRSLCVSFADCVFINIEDRLPKLRGGNAYMYNCVADNSQYYSYRAQLKSANAQSLVQKVNTAWKCALVSQGIVCGDGGSVMAENCIYRGVETLLKNNDTKNSGQYARGGYCIKNCEWQKGSASDKKVGSSSDAGTAFLGAANLSAEYFEWHTEDGNQPFIPAVFALDKLEEALGDAAYGAGARSAFPESLLKSSYTA